MEGPPLNDLCSVCHGNFHIPCQANCSHWFCGSCIMEVWHHGSAVHPCKCPLCRRPITLLVPTQDSLRQNHDPEIAQVLRKIETYNRLFGGRETSLVQRVQDLPFLLRRLFREFLDPQRSLPLVIRARVYIAVRWHLLFLLNPDMCIMCGALLRISATSVLALFCWWFFIEFIVWPFFVNMILSAVYVISPIDIIPEGILGIVGLLDDFLIVLMCFLHVAALYRSVLYLRHGGS